MRLDCSGTKIIQILPTDSVIFFHAVYKLIMTITIAMTFELHFYVLPTEEY
jgi:hypothetical protein